MAKKVRSGGLRRQAAAVSALALSWLLAAPPAAMAQGAAAPGAAASASPTEGDAKRLKQAALDAYNAKRHEKAVQRWKDYLVLQPADAQAHRVLGDSLTELARFEEAIAARSRAVELDPKDSRNWNGRCWTLILANQPLQARPDCEQALARDEDNWAARVNLGHTWLLAGDAPSAQRHYRDVLWRVGNESDLRGGPLADFDIFVARGWQTEASRQAREWFQKQWPRWQQVRQLLAEEVHLRTSGKAEDALAPAKSASALADDVLGPDHPQTLALHFSLGESLRAVGRYNDALPLFARALAITEKANGCDHPSTGISLQELSELHMYLGHYDRALPLLTRALAISEKAQGPEHPSTGTSLNNLAGLYRAMGQYDRALPLYTRALAISEKTEGPEHPSTGIGLNNLAGLYVSMGEHDRAVQLYARALAITEKAKGAEHRDTGIVLNRFAGFYRAMGQYDRALPLYTRALAISEKALGPEHHETGRNLNDLAGLYQLNGHHERALPLSIRALGIAERAVVPELTWNVLNTMMELYGRRRSNAPALHQPALAIWYGKQAVNTLQSVRGRMSGLDKDLQKGFLAKNEGAYQTLATLLIESGRIAEAEQVLAMLKERELSELVRSGPSGTQADFVGVERRALAEQQRLAAIGVKDATELAALERRIDAGETLPAADAERRAALLRAAEVWRADYQRFMSGLGQLFAEAARPLATQGADVQSTRLQARVALDPAGALGLHYVVTDERVGIIVATASGSFGRFSAVPRVELNRQISALRQAIGAKADTRAPAQALWQMLIAPVQADIAAAGAKTLVLSLTDTLRYLPFAALQNPEGRYLVEDHALALWAAAADSVPAPSTAGWRVAALGLTQAREGFSELPGVHRELHGIVRTETNQGGVLPGRIALDDQFDLTQLKTALDGQTNVVHVASHFAFRPGDESRSVLVVGRGDPISLGQLAVMNFRRVEQLTLSACDTATGGGVNENGAEVEGLAAAVLKQQAKAVLATLWKVADDSTASLMRSFYAQRANSNPVSRAQALRQAQLGLLRGAAGSAAGGAGDTQRAARALGADGKPVETTAQAPVDPSRPWAHPYYWAPFVLSGSWL